MLLITGYDCKVVLWYSRPVSRPQINGLVMNFGESLLSLVLVSAYEDSEYFFHTTRDHYIISMDMCFVMFLLQYKM